MQKNNFVGEGTSISLLRGDIMNNNQRDIKNLVEDIHKDLDNKHDENIIIKNNINRDQERDTDNLDSDVSTENRYSDVSTESKKQKSKATILKIQIPELIKEPILLLIIYLIMSQDFVKNNVAKYVSQIQPDNEGNIGFYGVFIYGIILVVTYSFFKRILL